MQDLLNYPAHYIATLFKKGEISPSEFLEFIYKRIEKLDTKLNAFITLCPDAAMKQAKVVENNIKTLSPLAGIPIAIKDNICTYGILTTCGSKILENFIPVYDATVIKRLKEAGLIIVGKTNMDEFAMGSSCEHSYFGPTKNPWTLGCVAGGSSGGSAAAVAARLVPLALGSDTGGSVRQPASFTGIYGLKPTYGRVSRYGLIAFASSLDVIGAFTWDITDMVHLYKIIAGFDPYDSTSINRPVDVDDCLKEGLEGIRLGIAKEYFPPELDSNVRELVISAADKLKSQGAKLCEISLPHTKYSIPTYYIIAPAEASSNLARYEGVRYGYRERNYSNLDEMYSKTRSVGFGAEVKRRILLGTYTLSSGYYDAYYLRAQKVRSLILRDFKEAFKVVDAIITPTSPTVAFPLGERIENPLQMYLSDIFTTSVNLAGLPAISIPCGFSYDLPVGLQFITDALNEKLLFKLAYNFQLITDYHKKMPPLS